MKLIVVAAGLGTRLRRGPKHLLELWGYPLIYYPLEAHRRAWGAEEALIVVQERFLSETQAALKQLEHRLSISFNLIPIFNLHCENGFSLVKGLEAAREEVVLTVADHVYDVCIPLKLIKECPSEADVCVAGDRNPRLIDVDEATKIEAAGVKALRFSKKLQQHDFIDTGVFLIRNWKLIVERYSDRLDMTMSMVWNDLVKNSAYIHVVDVTGCLWADVDTEADLMAFMSSANPRREFMEQILAF